MTKSDRPEDRSPAQQKGEEFGKIKRPQQTDATMPDDDTARGAEVSGRQHATHRN